MSRSSKSLCSGLDGRKLIELRNRVPDFVDSGHQLDENKGISELDVSAVLMKKRMSEVQEGKKKGKKGKNGEADRGTCGEDKAMETIIGRKSLRSHNADKEAKTLEPIESSSKRESCSKKQKYEGEHDNANDSDLVLPEKRHSLRSKSQLSSISESVGTSDSPVMETTIVAQEEQDPGTPVIDTGNQENALSNVEKQLSDFAPEQETESSEKTMFNLLPLENLEKTIDVTHENVGLKSLGNLGDSTARFFESMAMTVATFPQHIQASIKARVCKLVVEMEYSLSLPPAL